MKQETFVKIHQEKWKLLDQQLRNREVLAADDLADRYIDLTDDLSYAQTHFPDSLTTQYLNQLAARVHHLIYQNKPESRSRIRHFWKTELPLIMYEHRKTMWYSAFFFFAAVLIGAFSAWQDDSFVRLILGDGYVNMTLNNIDQDDPMAVYKGSQEIDMFLGITINNIRVSFLAFVMGIFWSVGTVWVLIQNGIMLGSFQYFFYQHGVLSTSLLTIYIHGTLEISAIVIAGGAGLVIGNSLLFPGTYSRTASLLKGAKDGMKIAFGLVPVFITAGFLESFVTRHYQQSWLLNLSIILISAFFIVFYFFIYPIIVHRKMQDKMTPDE